MVPTDKDTHTLTYMHVKNRNPNSLYRLKNSRSPFPSLFTSLPEAECLKPRAANLGWTKCYILTGSPYSPYGPRDGVASWAMLTEQGEALAACTERGGGPGAYGLRAPSASSLVHLRKSSAFSAIPSRLYVLFGPEVLTAQCPREASEADRLTLFWNKSSQGSLPPKVTPYTQRRPHGFLQPGLQY